MNVFLNRGLAAAVSLVAFAASASEAVARVEAGMLTCEVEEGFALIFSKPRDLHCVFHKANDQTEAYSGTLREVGLDVGVSGRGVIAWAVLAQTTQLSPGELAGTYGGVEVGAAAGVGARGQAMIGGARRTISLQPISVEGEVGINIAVGITSMELRPLFRGTPASDSTARVSAVGHSYESVPHERQHAHYGCGSYTHLQHGQTLYGLAHTCGVTLEALLDANPNISNVREIADGALIHVPSHVGHHANSPCGDRAILQQGESLDQLAWRCGVTLHTLLRANPGIREFAALKPGLVLDIPDRSERPRQAPVRWAKMETDVVTDAPSRDVPQVNDGGRVTQLPGQVATGQTADDAKVPGTSFHATGPLSCARSAGQPMGNNCQFGVVRKGNGNGSITIFWPDGGNRVIYFEDMTPVSYDESQADAGAKMTVSRTADYLYTVKIGEQRFEIPEAVMSGG